MPNKPFQKGEIMSHLPFESWILEYDTLEPEERRSLQGHLESCKQCKRMQNKWLAAQQELRARRMATPAPGFSQRWLSSLVLRRAQEARKQAWRIFGALLAAALLVLLILAGYVMTTTTVTDWFAALIRIFTSSLNTYSLVEFGVTSWFESTPLALNIALWIYLTVTLCLLSLGWVFVLWRTSLVGVFKK
jgi:hypothetical protein